MWFFYDIADINFFDGIYEPQIKYLHSLTKLNKLL